MKKTQTLPKQIENLIKQHKNTYEEDCGNLEFIDINKKIESMLTGETSNKEDYRKTNLSL